MEKKTVKRQMSELWKKKHREGVDNYQKCRRMMTFVDHVMGLSERYSEAPDDILRAIVFKVMNNQEDDPRPLKDVIAEVKQGMQLGEISDPIWDFRVREEAV